MIAPEVRTPARAPMGASKRNWGIGRVGRVETATDVWRERAAVTERARARSAPELPPSFDDFFGREYRRVVALAMVLCGRSTLAEELAQDAFLAAFRRWERIAGYDDPAAWVRRVAANLATSSRRRAARELRLVARLSWGRAEVREIDIGDEALWSAVRALPRRQAQCLALRYLEDRSTAEIAAVLGIAEPTVRVHLHQGRMALEQRLTSDPGDSP
jgi:RNA polymerase sigma-70 factor (ECF subfamily)